MAKRSPSGQALCVAVVLASTSPAFANGRFPRAERLIENPHDPQRLYLAGTYGILTTRDRGRSWYHLCEASFSLQDAYLGDPILDLMANQSLLVGVQTSLNLSLDDGCQWAPVLRPDAAYVIDHSIARSEPSTVVVLLANYRGGGVGYSLEQSTDDGATWGPIGIEVPADSMYTIDVDPRDPSHLYATGLLGNVGQLFTSPDRGATWTAHSIPNTDASQAPYIAALHPLDPKRIFVRTDSWIPIDGALTANDALLYSADGGETWTELFRSRAKLFGFALSPDASAVLIGYGDPQEGGGEVVTGPFGVFKSPTDRFSFESIFSGRVGCVAWTQTGVYVCGSQSFDGFELAFSPNADFAADGGCIEPLLLLNQVAGPLACGAGTTGFACQGAWGVACSTFGACQDAGARQVGCVGAMTSDRPAAPIHRSAGCGCHIERQSENRAGALFSLVALASLTARARRRGPR
jgi:photosystem II stability/assembly factor-like uncharacterized protein